MPIRKPYFNLHQIQTGQYTSGGEFVLATGEVYIGAYHVIPTGQRFTGFRPETGSVELFELRLNSTYDILTYNKLTESEGSRYLTPISFSPVPTMDDYKVGRIERFFIQKRNSAMNTILEIDSPQFNSINTKNNPGINGVIYNSLRVEWIISKIPIEDARYLNSFTVQKSLPTFPGLNLILTNPLEFYR